MDVVESFSKSLYQIEGMSPSKEDAHAAFHNLSGYMGLLLKINEREKIISAKRKDSHDEN